MTEFVEEGQVFFDAEHQEGDKEFKKIYGMSQANYLELMFIKIYEKSYQNQKAWIEEIQCRI